MSKPITKKSLFVCLAVSLAIIIAGAFLFGFLGFNPDSTTSSYRMIEVADNLSSLRDETAEEGGQSLYDFCRSEIEGANYKIVHDRKTDSTALGSTIEFVVSGGSEEDLQALVTDLQKSIGEKFGDLGDSAVVTVSSHTVENQPYYEYIWRTAIGAGVALVLLFAYVAIRFRVGMGFTALIAAVHDVLLTLAAVALLRIPAGITLIGVAAFSLLLSAVLNLIVFGKIRRDLRSEERKALPVREGVALAVRDSLKNILIVCILLAAFAVVLGCIGAFIGFDLLSVMLSMLMAIVISAYSSLFLSPAIYAGIKERSDRIRAEKAKYNYASEKKREKAAQAAEKQAPAESN